ncbi:hypothetical protein Hanom_Chr13g01234141 [Helianthus anomalus]
MVRLSLHYNPNKKKTFFLLRKWPDFKIRFTPKYLSRPGPILGSNWDSKPFSTSTNHMAGNSIPVPLGKTGGRHTPIRPTSLLFYTRFKITFLPQNSVSLPLVQLGGGAIPIVPTSLLFYIHFKITFLPPVIKYGFASTSKYNYPFAPS